MLFPVRRAGSAVTGVAGGVVGGVVGGVGSVVGGVGSALNSVGSVVTGGGLRSKKSTSEADDDFALQNAREKLNLALKGTPP